MFSVELDRKGQYKTSLMIIKWINTIKYQTLLDSRLLNNFLYGYTSIVGLYEHIWKHKSTPGFIVLCFIEVCSFLVCLFLQIKGKTSPPHPATSKKSMTCFIEILTLLWWPGTKPTKSLSYACILIYYRWTY